MIKITFPDGKIYEVSNGTTPYQIAESISISLKKNAVVAIVNGMYHDMNRSLENDSIITFINKGNPEGLNILRHDCAHLLAQAVQELFTDVQITFGPATKNGFYYDFFRKIPFSENDFPVIENKMKEIVDRDDLIVREVWTRDQTIDFFKKKGEFFKIEWLNELPSDEMIIYRQGEWLDLCRGPHMPSTRYIGKFFKLLKISGSYWRGDIKNQQLQRIYGTAFWSKKDLDAYLQKIEESKKRDHRLIGKTLSLFHLQDEAIGSIFWHPKGTIIYSILQDYMRKKLLINGYDEVKTPQLIDRVLWEKSGHWDKFKKNMFIVSTEYDKREILALKPMNCPAHVQIFNKKHVSYRQLPWRMAEFGSCHRYEPHGALHGIMRTRFFTQDDAHIFCTSEQIIDETACFCRLLKEVYADFGFHDLKIKFSDRPEVRSGDDSMWDLSEQSLKEAIDFVKIPYTINPGEGAFYGPKLEFILVDAIDRDWQCGTLQVDFIMPKRLGATYIGIDNKKHTPVMIHRAILGSFERFIGILIEQYAGHFPVWLAPIQVIVLNISQKTESYAKEIYKKCLASGIRTQLDIRSEKIDYKIREHSLQKIPYFFIVGDKEMQNNQISVREFKNNNNIILSVSDAIMYVKDIKL